MRHALPLPAQHSRKRKLELSCWSEQLQQAEGWHAEFAEAGASHQEGDLSLEARLFIVTVLFLAAQLKLLWRPLVSARNLLEAKQTLNTRLQLDGLTAATWL